MQLRSVKTQLILIAKDFVDHKFIRLYYERQTRRFTIVGSSYILIFLE